MMIGIEGSRYFSRIAKLGCFLVEDQLRVDDEFVYEAANRIMNGNIRGSLATYS